MCKWYIMRDGRAEIACANFYLNGMRIRMMKTIDKNIRTTAIVLSAGFGKRMNSDVPKQYMMLNEKPIIYYTLKAFEDSIIDDIVLVTGAGDEEFCRKEIVDKYGFAKVKKIVIKIKMA